MLKSGNFFGIMRNKLQIRSYNKTIYEEAFTHRSLNIKNKKYWMSLKG